MRPKCSATQTAASFPLGSITPNSKSQRVISSPVLRPAVVPPVELATAELRATATDWLVETRIEAFENDQPVFSRDWQFRIPRDLM